MAPASRHVDGGRSQYEIWNDLVGEAWVRHARIHDRQAEPFGLAVLDALGDLEGARVLDVGCGTGATTTQLIERRAAEVVGVDLSEPMITAARALVHDPRAHLELGDVLEVDLGGEFDVVFSRFGVMFFTDPTLAFARLHSLSTSAARLGFCCWGPPFANPVMTLPVMAASAVLGQPQLAAPGEPGPFSLSSPDVVRDVLTAAGWSTVETTDLSLDPPHPAGNAEKVAEVVTDFNPLLVAGLGSHPDRRDDTRTAIIDALKPLERDGIVHLAAHALVVTAHA
jgi:SAM-dependent methyltransferase